MILAQSTAFRKSVLSQMGALEMIQQKNSFPGGVRPIPLSSAQSDSQVPVGMEGQIRRGAHETIPQLGGQVPWLFTLRRGPVQWTKRVNVLVEESCLFPAAHPRSRSEPTKQVCDGFQRGFWRIAWEPPQNSMRSIGASKMLTAFGRSQKSF